MPGVGKSTFIEALGLCLIAQGHRVAVLAIDPSSTVSGGSILGDKTRMEQLSVHEQAYIRPSPSSGTLGGVAEKTREAMLVCEAAGYDIVIVETVGVGQSETAVAGMTDMFVLLQLPNAGDDLQAIKKGVMELADLVVINKADIDATPPRARRRRSPARCASSASTAMPATRTHDDSLWHPQVLQLSALKGEGVDASGPAVTHFRALQAAQRPLAARRRHQALAWMWERIDSGLRQAFRQHPEVQAMLPAAHPAKSSRAVSRPRRRRGNCSPRCWGRSHERPGARAHPRLRRMAARPASRPSRPADGPVIVEGHAAGAPGARRLGAATAVRAGALARAASRCPRPAAPQARPSRCGACAELRAAGVRVPAVLHVDAEFFVMERFAGPAAWPNAWTPARPTPACCGSRACASCGTCTPAGSA